VSEQEDRQAADTPLSGGTVETTIAPLLSGLRVLDLTWGTAGPILGMMLADLGANVTKVEPSTGDPFRAWCADSYRAWNRGKRSLAVDIFHPDGKALMEKMLERTDVMIQSFAPAVARRLGVDYEALGENHPRLVYCSISAYGDGPGSDRPGWDPLINARFGVLQPDSTNGIRVSSWPGLAYGVAFQALVSIASGLWVRAKDGRGQQVRASYLDAHLGMSGMGLFRGDQPLPALRLAAMQGGDGGPVLRFITGSFECSDGEYIQVHTGTAGSCDRLLVILGLNELLSEPSASKGIGGFDDRFTGEQHAYLQSALPGAFLTRTRAEWLALLIEADVPSTPVRRIGESLDDEQVGPMGGRVAVDDPDLGRLIQVALPIKIDGLQQRQPEGAPLVGQHTDEVAAEVGYSPDDIRLMRAAEVIA
jgi:crotonobetainyl-CoA:carnitine CoA-transferase CaiB-like acyl-CoA transferase